MNRNLALILIMLAAALPERDAAAQWNVDRFGTERNRVYATFGLDPALIPAVGYGRVIPIRNHPFQFTGEVGLVAARMDTRDYRVRLGAQTSVVQWRSLRVTGSATFITRGTKNAIYRGVNFGADFTGAVGVYRPRWFSAAEFGKDKAIITHITHSDWYKAHYYAGAKDGWYLNAGGTYHLGIAGGVAIRGAEVVGRLGLLRTERLNALTPPMYVSLGVGYGF